MKQSKNKKLLLSALGIILVLALAIGAWAYFRQINSASSDNKKQTDGTVIENKTVENAEKPSPTQSPQEDTITVTISQVSQNSSQLIIRALVDGASTGECSLSLKKGTTTITKTAAITAGPSYYYCNGFTISKNELTPKGVWQMNLLVSSGGKTGNAIQEVTVE